MAKRAKNQRNWIISLVSVPFAAFFLFASIAVWFGETAEPTWPTALARLAFSVIFFVIFVLFTIAMVKGSWRYFKETLLALFTAV